MHGFIILHGKHSGPNKPNDPSRVLYQNLSQKYPCDYSEYCWSLNRKFDSTVEQSLEDIKHRVDKMKIDCNVDQVHLVGHSTGGNIAIRYALEYNNVSSYVLLCPAHTVHNDTMRRVTNYSLKEAKKYLDQNDNELKNFVIFDSGDIKSVQLKPKEYISWFDPHGKCNMITNCAKINKPINVYVISGNLDRDQITLTDIKEANIGTSLSKYEIINESHHMIPKVSSNHILKWVNELENNIK